jgi:excisionase family DNA binding protein
MNNSTQFDEIMDAKEVCAYLKICKGTLQKLNLPVIIVRRRRLFKKSQIDQFIEENTKGGKK